MKLDRSKRLLLTTLLAVAAAGCSTNQIKPEQTSVQSEWTPYTIGGGDVIDVFDYPNQRRDPGATRVEKSGSPGFYTVSNFLTRVGHFWHVGGARIRFWHASAGIGR